MLNQIKANLYRLCKKKSTFIVFGVCFGMGLLFAILYAAFSSSVFDISLIFIAVIVPSFLCLNFSNGLIRNKLLAGNSKTSIYLSDLLTSCILGLSLWLAYQIPSVIVIAIVGGVMPAWQIAVYIPVGLVSVIGICSLFTFIGMNVKSYRSTVACLILTFIFSALSALCILSLNGVLPQALAGVFVTIFRLLPPQLMMGYIGAGWQVCLYAIGGIGLTAIFTTAGLLAVKKTDYK